MQHRRSVKKLGVSVFLFHTENSLNCTILARHEKTSYNVFL